MNSLRAFQDANSLGGFEISRVSNLGTSNSVWLCSYRKQLKLVLKYFPKDNHGNLHFKSEKNAILKNQELSFFPKMIAFDDKENWFATEYEKSDDMTQVDISAVIDLLDTKMPLVKVPSQAHVQLPGILNFSLDEKLTKPGEKVIRNILQTTAWFANFSTDVQKAWKSEVAIHGDLKLPNLVLGINGIVIFDWEHIAVGAKYWDVVGILQSTISEALENGKSAVWAKRNLADCVEMIWNLDEISRKALALRCVQTSLELTTTSSLIPISAVNMLQVAEFIATINKSGLDDVVKIAS